MICVFIVRYHDSMILIKMILNLKLETEILKLLIEILMINVITIN